MILETFEREGLRLFYRAPGIDRSIITEIVERDDYRLTSMALQPAALVIDVGAHIGVFSCTAAHRFPDARVLACEMDDENAAVLRLNAGAYPAVTPMHRTVVGADPPAGYRRNPSNSGGHHIGGACPAPPAITLAELAGAERVALLKMDCEGAEYGILRLAAADGTLALVDRVAMEYHHFFDEHHETLVRLLEGAGLTVEVVPTNDMCGMLHATRRS